MVPTRIRPAEVNASLEPWHQRAFPAADAEDCGAAPSAVLADQPVPIQSGTTQAPFLNLRKATLGYHGSDEEFVGLTEYRIGWFGPTNLDQALSGDLWWAATHAVREANAQASSPPSRDAASVSSPRSPISDPGSSGSNSLPFRLVARWSENVWGTGVSQLARMIYEERPIAVIGSVDSASTHLAEQVVAKANLPLVSPIATDPSITIAGVPWMFSCAPSDRAIAQVLVNDVLRTLASAQTGHAGIGVRPSETGEGLARTSGGGTLRGGAAPGGSTVAEGGRGLRLAVVVATDHESRMTAREVWREFVGRRRVPDFRFDVQPGAENLERHQAALAAARPDVILIVAGAEDAARLVRAVRGSLSRVRGEAAENEPGETGGERGGGWPRPVLFGSQSMGRTRFVDLAGSAGDGVRFPRLCMVDSADADTARFFDQFVAARQRPPDCAAVLAYDATRLVIEAIRRAGPSRSGVRSALAAISPWQGMGGVISFDGTGQNTRANITMATLREGRIVCVHEPGMARAGRGGGEDAAGRQNVVSRRRGGL